MFLRETSQLLNSVKGQGNGRCLRDMIIALGVPCRKVHKVCYIHIGVGFCVARSY